MIDKYCQWTLHYRSHSLTVQLRLCCSDTVLATQQTAAIEHSGYCYVWLRTLIARYTYRVQL